MVRRSRPSRRRRTRSPMRADAFPGRGGLLDVVLATRNPGKVRELLALLRDLPLRVYDLTAFPRVPELAEEGQTYTENAISKALQVARLTGRVALADDSGIEIDGLGGGPGPQSRRFLGPQASDAARNARILKLLQDAPPQARRARYRAVVAIATPQGVVRTFEGVCEGEIAPAPRGSHGFGYDPIFFVPAYGKTMAQLPPAVKNKISHRARAIAAARPFLRLLATGRTSPPEP